MNHLARTLLFATTLAVPLGGCASMSDFTIDPTEWLAGDWFGNKKKLPGERKPVFPEGVPGVTRGIPPDLVKGNQPQPEVAQDDALATQAIVEQQPKPKAKPKPKGAAKPAPVEPESRPTPVTVRRSDGPSGEQQPAASEWPDPSPPRRQQPAATQWPEAPAPRSTGQSGGVQWPDPPAPSR